MSWLRRSTKLMSCSSTRLATGAISPLTWCTPTWTWPPSSESRGSGCSRCGLRLAAAQVLRKARGAAQQRAVERAQADRVQALVLHRAVEQRLQALHARFAHRRADRVGQRVGDQRAARVQVAREPAQGQLIHQRQSPGRRPPPASTAGGSGSEAGGSGISSSSVEPRSQGTCRGRRRGLAVLGGSRPGGHRAAMARIEGTLQGVIVYSSGCSKGPPKHLSHRGTYRSRQRHDDRRA